MDQFSVRFNAGDFRDGWHKFRAHHWNVSWAVDPDFQGSISTGDNRNHDVITDQDFLPGVSIEGQQGTPPFPANCSAGVVTFPVTSNSIRCGRGIPILMSQRGSSGQSKPELRLPVAFGLRPMVDLLS